MATIIPSTVPSVERLAKEVFTCLEIYYDRHKGPQSRLGYLAPWEMAGTLDSNANRAPRYTVVTLVAGILSLTAPASYATR